MNKFNNRVSPGNRVDFSRIRKAQSGMTAEQIKRRKDIYGTPQDFIVNGKYDMGKIQAYYEAHPELFKDVDLSVITATPDWNKKNGFLEWNKQFNQTGLNQLFGWDESSADLIGPTTRARKDFVDWLKTRTTGGGTPGGTPQITGGSTTVTNEGDGNGGNGSVTITGGNNGDNTGGSSGNNQSRTTGGGTGTGGNRQTLTFGKQFPKRQGAPWTDWLPLSGILGNNLLNNQWFFNNEVQKKFPLKEGPYLQGKVTNNYAGRQMREQQMADARSRAQQQLGSNIDQNQAYLQQVEQNLQPLENQNAIDKTNEFNQTSQNLQDIENENKITAADTANYNRVQNTAAFNSILAARQKRNASNIAELNSYIDLMTTSHGQWLQNERMEDARYQREINDYNYQTKLYELYDSTGLKKLESGIQNSSAFEALRSQIQADTSINDINFGPDRTLTDDVLLEYIQTHSDNPYVKQAIAAYQKELDAANSRFEHERTKIVAERTESNLQIPTTITNNGTRFGDKYIRHSIYQPRNPLYKHGGKMGRFIDYMNHYQKQQQFDRREARKAQENLQKKLARDLDYLDKETLMLLKQIFK